MSTLVEYFDALVQADGRTYHGFTLTDLEHEAHPDEWAELAANPSALRAFALALRESMQLAQGVCPDRWTGAATCAGCGAIPVAPFLDGATLGACRWCSVREQGIPIPRPPAAPAQDD